MKRNKILALGITSVLLLTGCGSESQMEVISPVKTVRFSWWGNDGRNSYTIDAVEEFESENSDIDVICEYGEWDGFVKRMEVEIASGEEADVMQVNYDWIYEYSGEENFYNLYELEKYIDLDSFSEEDLSYGIVDGKLLGIPTALNALTFYYNKTIYDSYGLSLPETWDDLFEAAEAMSADGIYPLECNQKSLWLSLVAHTEQESGVKFLDGKGNITFTAENLAQMLKFHKQLVDEKVLSNDEYNKDNFINGKTAGSVRWISDTEYYCKPAQDNGYEITIGEYPVLEGASVYGWYAKPTSLYCISKDTKEPETAAKLVNYLLNSEEMAERQGIEKGIPLSKSMLEVLEAKDMLEGLEYDANSKLTECSEDFECIDPKLENLDMINAYFSAFNDVYYNGADINATAETLYEQIVEILA